VASASIRRRLEKLEAAVEQKEAAKREFGDPWESFFDKMRRLAKSIDEHPPVTLTPAEERERAEEAQKFWDDLNEKLALSGRPPTYDPGCESLDPAEINESRIRRGLPPFKWQR
jgi:hypothetical protein